MLSSFFVKSDYMTSCWFKQNLLGNNYFNSKNVVYYITYLLIATYFIHPFDIVY